MAALREILSVFDVSVDPQGKLAVGHKSVDRLKRGLEQLSQASKEPARRVKQVGEAATGLGRGAAAATRSSQATRKLSQAWRGLGAALVRGRDRLRAATGALNRQSRGLKQVDGNAKAMAASLGIGAGDAGLLTRLSRLRRLFHLTAFASAIGAGALAAFTNATLKQIDAIGKGAARLAVSTDSYQVLAQFANEAGTSVEGVATASNRLARNANDAVTKGTGPAADAFRRLGLELSDLTDGNGQLRGIQDLLFDVGGALGELEDPTQRLAIAQELLGRSGTQILPGFKAGRAAALEQKKALQGLAVVYDKELIAAVEATNDQLSRGVLAFDRVKAQIIQAMLPSLQGLATWLQRTGVGIAKWIEGIDLGRITVVALTTALLALLPAALPVLGAIAAAAAPLLIFGAIVLVVEDLVSAIEGGESAIKDLLASLFGLEAATSFIDELRFAWELASDAVRIFWDLITGGSGIADEIINRFSDNIDKLKQRFVDFFDGVFSRAGELLSFVGKILPGQFESFGNGAPTARTIQAPPSNVAATDARTQNVNVNVQTGASPSQIAQASVRELGRSPSSVLASVGGG